MTSDGEHYDRAAGANRWLSPAKTIAASLIGCALVVTGLVTTNSDVALLGVTCLVIVTGAKFVLAVLGNAYRPGEKRYRHGCYSSLFGTDAEARETRDAGRQQSDR